MTRKKLPYKESSVFTFPLRGGGYATGVVARTNNRGVILAYLFGPRHQTRPTTIDVTNLDPKRALSRLRCGDLGFLEGGWQVIGEIPNWSRETWPMPYFIWRDPLSPTRAALVLYSDENPNEIVKEVPADPEAKGFEKGVLYGAGAVEIYVSHILNQQAPSEVPDQPSP